MILYSQDELYENYYNFIRTEISKKAIMSEHYNLISGFEGFEKNQNDVVLFNVEDYLNNLDYFNEKYSIVRLQHIKESGLNLLNEHNVKHRSMKIVEVIKLIDGDFLNFPGKKYRVERWTANKYDNMGFEVKEELDTPGEWEQLYHLLNYWDKYKKETGTRMTFTGQDRSFFIRFYKDFKSRFKVLSLFFFHNGKLIAYQFMENSAPNFWNLHTRKTDRFNYSNLNLYVDIYTFRKIYNETNEPFLVNMGMEMNKLTDYKEKRFPTYFIWNTYNATIENTNNDALTNIDSNFRVSRNVKRDFLKVFKDDIKKDKELKKDIKGLF